MLDSVSIWAKIRRRLCDGPLGSHLDSFVDALREQGYRPSTIRRYILAADKLGVWMRRQRKTAEDLDEVTVERFVASLGRRRCPQKRGGRLPDVAIGAHKIAAHLWQQGVARQSAAYASTAEQWLESYDAHLDEVKGLSSGTRRLYVRYARMFIDARFGAGTLDWSKVMAQDVAVFVTDQATRLRASSRKAPVTATRAMLRFLELTGDVPVGLSGAVPTVRLWKQAALPRHLSAVQVEAVLECCGPATAVRMRDRAVLLLLARLGLRGGEVQAIQLDDIDWRKGVIHLRPGKSGRERLLPMTEEVGQAIASYLRDGRPHSSDSAMFVRSCPPYQGFQSPAAISTIAKAALLRAGITGIPLGSHAFRHTAATLMVRKGVAFKEIADVLGHSMIETTAIYAKLDLESLATVALPWPECSS